MTLNPEQQKLIDELVESGLFSSPDDVINAALSRLVEDHDEDLDALHKSVQVGLDQLERGEYTDYDEEGLKGLAESIKTRGRERLKAEGHLHD